MSGNGDENGILGRLRREAEAERAREPQVDERYQTRAPGERPKPGQCTIDGEDIRNISDDEVRLLLGLGVAEPLMRDLIEGEARYRGLLEP